MGEGNKKIIVTGHISLDITPVFQNSGRWKLSELFQPGKLLKVGKAMMCTGGAVSNTGPGLERLGTNVILMAKMGDDYFGNALKDMMSAHGCESCISQAPGENTFYTIVLAPKGLDRFLLHDPGCSDTFGYAGVDFGKVEEATHFHFGYPPIICRFYLDDRGELVRLFKKVESMGLTTSLDPAAVDLDSEATDMNRARVLERVLPYVDFFVLSIEELGYMLDRPLYCKWQEAAGGGDVTGILSFKEDVGPLATRALSMRTRCALLRCGAAGVYLKTAPEPVWKEVLPGFTGWNSISHSKDSYVSDCTLSGTGTGDTSIAAFVKTILDGCEPLECVRLAAVTGTSCVMAYDALSGLLLFGELRQKIEAGWKKQSIIHP